MTVSPVSSSVDAEEGKVKKVKAAVLAAEADSKTWAKKIKNQNNTNGGAALRRRKENNK